MRIRILAGVLILSIVGAARADVSVDYAIDGDCAVEPAGLKISGSQLRVEAGVPGVNGSVLFDGLEDLVTYLDHERRSWYEMEVDLDAADYMGDVAKSSGHFVDREMEKAQAQMKEACKQMEKQGMACPDLMDPQAMMAMAQGMGASVSPDAMESLGVGVGVGADGEIDEKALEDMKQQLLDGGGGAARVDPRALAKATAPSSFTDSGRDENIDGATCRWYEQCNGEQLMKAQCVVPVDQLAIGDRDRAGMKRALLVLQRFGNAFQPMMERYGVATEPPPSSRGLVTVQRCYDARGQAAGSARASISQATLDENVFEVPAGYARQRMDGAQ